MSSTRSMLGNEDDASVYSRSPDCPKLELPSQAPTVPPPAGFDLPDISPLDHQIALAGGSTMALDTTRTRLQAVKSARRRSIPETMKDKRQQWEQQERENQFYEHCLHIFQHLTAVAIDVSQELSLLQYFEPEVNLAGHPRIWGAAQKLRGALRQAQEREAVAEYEWKKQWNMPRMGLPSSRWV
ncbi:hypothetical protein ASPCAL14874 [Aspergillus calidoustus]|uniref:Uncharacterized protein n=1 Tax=Aspergillus calidoustus TaxID=454130 RepID=A0A0U5GGZ1_ASPCI|nr:hypothetical protein ASPCAL14874 [Aspergillus calidoustus]